MRRREEEKGGGKDVRAKGGRVERDVVVMIAESSTLGGS